MQWFKNAIFYSLDIETFYDSDGDGIGDIQGLIAKLDYIAGLGVNCIWLLPFYPSPNRDNGYDVMDYYGVDERLGSPGDFAEFMDKAGSLGIRVIIDLVVNHTSVQHKWFQAARQSPDSPFRDYYVWADEPLEYETEHLMFTGEENTIWTYDEKAGQYYLHRFYSEQPDLNISTPEVREEILKIMGYWLELGVSGFRIDAAEMLIEAYGMEETERQELVRFLTEMHDFVVSRKKDAILLAEANVFPKQMHTYLDNGSRMHMLFNFYVNQFLFLSLAQRSAEPLSESLQQLPKLADNNQWLNFLRHHDELSLSLLTDEEQQTVFEAFAPQENMRIYGRGIRRRLSPMLEANEDRLKFCYALMFGLPGIGIIRYGDEIGMGDDLNLQGRNSVRTPMQWNSEKNGGFSSADQSKLVHPVIEEGQFGFRDVNVQNAQSDPESILNWMQRMVSIRKQCPEIGDGQFELISGNSDEVLMISYRLENERLLMIYNFSGKKTVAELPESIEWISLFEESSVRSGKIPLTPFGFAWYRASNDEN